MKRPITYASLALAAGVGLGAIGVSAQNVDGGDPIDLFARMYPVFSHDRCTGCHGRVNPELESGNNHGGGHVPPGGQPCNDCHVPIRWRTRPDLKFLGKSVKQLCQMQSNFVHSMVAQGRATSLPNIVQTVHAEYISHLAQDSLIGSAFDGDRGGISSQADKPPISRDEFVKAGQEWLDAGAGCGGWEGKITQNEEFHSGYSYPMGGGDSPIDVQVNETAAREIKITRTDGSSTGTFKMSGHSTIVQTMHLIGEHGPCTAVNTANMDWLAPAPATVDVVVRVRTKSDGSYTIRFVGPEEKTVSSTTGDSVNDCGADLPHFPPDPPIELTWPGWGYTIRCPSSNGICKLFDPDNAALSGSTEETILGASDAVERKSWLNESPVGTSRSDDGTPIAVKVKTTWDLTLTN